MYCGPLTANNSQVLLVYDGYRSHMGLKVFETFREGNGMAYALPSHTGGTTQALDPYVFRSFKESLKMPIPQTSQPSASVEYDTFHFLLLISAAYRKAFMKDNVFKSFAAPSIHPFNPSAYLVYQGLFVRNA